MTRTLTLGLIGDPLPEFARPQDAMLEMIRRSADALAIGVRTKWIPTRSIADGERDLLVEADALWCTPGSPYLSLDGALAGIRYARENGVPFVGTCAGFQHAVLEFARNVLGIADAASEEYEPDSTSLFVTRLSCPIATQTLRIDLDERSHAAAVYAITSILEYYYCNFGLSAEFANRIDAAGLRIVGKDQNGEPRVLELREHPFFIVTLFVPGASYVEGSIRIAGAHPLVTALLRAGANSRKTISREAENARSAM
jgi:CTP synthase (UTP-ammonia lyase)